MKFCLHVDISGVTSLMSMKLQTVKLLCIKLFPSGIYKLHVIVSSVFSLFKYYFSFYLTISEV